MPSGTYSERISDAGTLEVTAADWHIRFYFAGPDRRYNGTFFRVPGSQVDEYVAAYLQNWQTYLGLKQHIPAGANFDQAGLLGMRIRIGSFAEGVCLTSYHDPIRDQGALNRRIEGLRRAAVKAREVQRLLRGLSTA